MNKSCKYNSMFHLLIISLIMLFSACGLDYEEDYKQDVINWHEIFERESFMAKLSQLG